MGADNSVDDNSVDKWCVRDCGVSDPPLRSPTAPKLHGRRLPAL